MNSREKQPYKKLNIATQIATTPTLYGTYAKEVFLESKSIPTKKSKDNGIKLIEKFNKLIKSEK